MGTWGYKTFEDDAACDWLSGLTASQGGALLEQALLAGDDEGRLDYARAVHILAAAEIVYGLLNGPQSGLPEQARTWIDANRRLDVACLKPVCERQLGRVLSEQSELRQRWQQNKQDYPDWKANVESLRNALMD